jgi:hypothetical protein
VTDKFEDFMDRLEMPLPEPQVVKITDKAGEIHALCAGFASIFTQRAFDMAESATDSMFCLRR